MRHKLAATALVATIVVLLPAPARADAGIDPRIAALQITMRSRSLYRGPVTGVAGPLTTRSLAILQQRLGVSSDGIFGPQTQGRLFPYGAPVLGTRLLGIGAKGYDVALLRVELALHGFPSGDFTTEYTARTARAVLRFQRFAGLPTTAPQDR